MNTNLLTPGFFAPTNMMLLGALRDDTESIRDRWHDEASTAAINGNPARARYIEDLARRLFA